MTARFVLEEQSPASAGFSAERLARLDAAMTGLVEGGAFAGMVTLLARRGQVVSYKAHGKQDLETGVPMARDTIFRCASMTKPVTGVAMMILYEEGKWRPEDPLHLHIPEFRDLKVWSGDDEAGRPILERPRHPPTVGELMSHTAGFSYGFPPATNPVDKAYNEAGLFRAAPGGRAAAKDLREFIERLAKIPLLYQPGSRWVYSVSVDIQGYLVEKLSGQTLPAFFRERIFAPLGMADSGFSLPEAKLPRLATTYMGDAAGGKLVPQPLPGDITAEPSLPSGGGGLVSTAPDYARFAQMLVNGGMLDGARILAPSSVRLMSANHLGEGLLASDGYAPARPNGLRMTDPVKTPDAFGVAFFRVRPGIGFGYDVSVIYDPERAGRTVGKGTYHWDGAYGTWFWVDPTHEVIFVGMIQRPDLQNIPNVQELTRTLVYQALEA